MLRASLAGVCKASRRSSATLPSSLLTRPLAAAAAAAAEAPVRPQSTLRQTAFAIIHGAGGKPLHNREILAALQASLASASPVEQERLTLTFVKTKILRHLREKGSIRSVATFTEGKKRPEYGYVVNTLPKEYKKGKPAQSLPPDA